MIFSGSLQLIWWWYTRTYSERLYLCYTICIIQQARHIICEVIRYKTIWYKLALHGWCGVCASVSYARHSHLNRDVNYIVNVLSDFYFVSAFVRCVVISFMEFCSNMRVSWTFFYLQKEKYRFRNGYRVILVQDRQNIIQGLLHTPSVWAAGICSYIYLKLFPTLHVPVIHFYLFL